MQKDVIQRVPKTNGFATITNSFLNHTKLSTDAKYLMIVIVNNDMNSWELNFSYYEKIFKWTKQRMKKAKDELIAYGYLSQEKKSDGKKFFYKYVVDESGSLKKPSTNVFTASTFSTTATTTSSTVTTTLTSTIPGIVTPINDVNQSLRDKYKNIYSDETMNEAIRLYTLTYNNPKVVEGAVFSNYLEQSNKQFTKETTTPIVKVVKPIYEAVDEMIDEPINEWEGLFEVDNHNYSDDLLSDLEKFNTND